MRSEGLSTHCTARGCKEGNGGKLVKLTVTTGYGKGVIACQQYEHLDRPYFNSFIERSFQRLERLTKVQVDSGCKMVTQVKTVL